MSGTSGTPRTQNYLLTTEFQDGQPSGSITPLDMRDFITSVPNFATLLNALNYGAVGNGSSNPASTKYGSLAALQAVYGTTISGVTVALTQELDWLSAQLAINTAVSRPTGGTVYFSSYNGAFILSNSNSVSDGSGTLTLPVTIPFWPNATPNVNLIGDGEDTTILKWPTDLGSGRFGIVCANRTTTNNGNSGIVQGMTLQGPGGIYSTSNIGTAQSSMSGFGCGSGKHVIDFGANGFRSGIDFVGGQNHFLRMRLENNYYNFYLSTPNTGGLVGDSLFTRCIFQNALLAGIGVNHAANVNECVFEKCTWDSLPFGFFKETNSGSPTQAQVMTGCTFIGSQFEQVGNAAIGDDTMTTAGGVGSVVSTMYNSHFKDTFFSWSSTYKASAYGAFVCFAAHDTSLCEFDGTVGLTPGSLGVFAFGNGAANGVTLRGDMATLIANITAATAKNFNYGGEFSTIRIINTVGTYWEGYTGCDANTLPAATQVCNANGGQFGALGLGAACGGTTADAPAGIVMQVNATAGTFGTGVMVADRGFVTVKSSGTFSTSANQVTWLRTGSAGAVIVASSSNDTATSPIVGILSSDPGSTTPTTVVIKLKGLS